MSRLIVREDARGELSSMLHELTLHGLLFAKGVRSELFWKNTGMQRVNRRPRSCKWFAVEPGGG